MHGKRFAVITALALAGVLLMAFTAQAANNAASWAGTTSGSWVTPANWNPATLPSNTTSQKYRVTIGDRGGITYQSVTLDLTRTVASLTLGTAAATNGIGYSLTIGTGRTLTLDTTGGNSGAFTIYAGNTLNLGDTAGSGQIWLSGDSTNYGAINLGGNTSARTGILSWGATAAAPVTIFNQGTGTITGFGSINDLVDNYGTVTANNAFALNINQNFTNEIGGVLNVGTGIGNPGLMVFASGTTLTNNGMANVYGTLTNNTGATWDLAHINLAGGTLTGATSNAAAWTGFGTLSGALNNTSTVNVTSGQTLAVSTTPSSFGAINVTGTGTTFNNNTSAVMSLAPFTLAGGNLTSTLTGTSNKGYTNSGTWGGYGAINKLTNTGTINADQFTLTLNGATTNTGGTLASTNGGSFISNGIITNGTISGNVAMNTGGGISATSGIMTLKSAISGEYGITSGTEVDLNGADLIGPTGFFHYITIAGAGPINLTGDSTWENRFQVNSTAPLNVNGHTLTLKNFTGSLPSGTFLNVNNNGNLKINGPAAVNSGGYIKLGGGNIDYTTSSTADTLQAAVTGYGDIKTKLLASNVTASGGTMYIDGGVDLNLMDGTHNNTSLASSSGAILDIRSTLTNPAYSTFAFTSYISPNGGTVNLDGATLTSTGNMNIDLQAGTANVTGDSTVSGKFQSEATLGVNSGKTLNIQNSTAAFTGAVTNNGTVAVQNSTVTFGNFTNNGAYTSDPSTQTFTNLTVAPTGYIQAAAGDTYIVNGSFANNSTQNGSWNTSAAILKFAGGGTHTFTLAGTGAPGEFGWGTLDLTGFTTGETLALAGPAGAALYVGVFTDNSISGTSVSDVTGNGLIIFYDPTLNAALLAGGNNGIYDLGNGGYLEPLSAAVPIPPSVLLLGTGLLGLVALRRRKSKAVS